VFPASEEVCGVLAEHVTLLAGCRDDERKLLEAALNHVGLDVIYCQYDEAWESTRAVACVVMDLSNREFDAALRLLQSPALARSEKLAFLAPDNPHGRLLATTMGIDDVVIKPLRLREIITKISLLAERYQERMVGLSAFFNDEIDFIQRLQDLAVMRFSGAMLLNGRGHKATICFEHGAIVGIDFGKRRNQAAIGSLWRLLPATHCLVPEAARPDWMQRKPLRLEAAEAVASFVESAEVFRKIFSGQDRLEEVLTVNWSAYAKISDSLPKQVRRIVQMFDGVRNLEDILDAVNFDEVLLLQILQKLCHKQILTQSGNESEDEVALGAWVSSFLSQSEAPGTDGSKDSQEDEDEELSHSAVFYALSGMNSLCASKPPQTMVHENAEACLMHHIGELCKSGELSLIPPNAFLPYDEGLVRARLKDIEAGIVTAESDIHDDTRYGENEGIEEDEDDEAFGLAHFGARPGTVTGDSSHAAGGVRLTSLTDQSHFSEEAWETIEPADTAPLSAAWAQAQSADLDDDDGDAAFDIFVDTSDDDEVPNASDGDSATEAAAGEFKNERRGAEANIGIFSEIEAQHRRRRRSLIAGEEADTGIFYKIEAQRRHRRRSLVVGVAAMVVIIVLVIGLMISEKPAVPLQSQASESTDGVVQPQHLLVVVDQDVEDDQDVGVEQDSGTPVQADAFDAALPDTPDAAQLAGPDDDNQGLDELSELQDEGSALTQDASLSVAESEVFSEKPATHGESRRTRAARSSGASLSSPADTADTTDTPEEKPAQAQKSIPAGDSQALGIRLEAIRTAMAKNDLEEAWRHMNALLAAYPRHGGVLTMAARLAARGGQYAEAIDYMKRAEHENAQKPAYWKEIANYYKRNGQPDLARIALERAIAIVGEDSAEGQALRRTMAN